VPAREADEAPPELVEQIVQAARTVRLRPGRNAAQITARCGAVCLSFEECRALATAVVTAVWPRLREARAGLDELREFIERGWDTHMRFGVLRQDGTTDLLPCADWCWACRLETAQAQAAAAEQLAEQWAALRTHGSAGTELRQALTVARSGTAKDTTC
jgi:hypothetical protein